MVQKIVIFVKVIIVMWIGDAREGWEPWVRCMAALVTDLVMRPTDACLDRVCDLLDVMGQILPGSSRRGLMVGEYLYFLPDSGCHLQLRRRHLQG